MASLYFDAYTHGKSNPPFVRFEDDGIRRQIRRRIRPRKTERLLSSIGTERQAELWRFRTNYDTVYDVGSSPTISERVLEVVELCMSGIGRVGNPSNELVPCRRKFPPMLKLNLDSYEWRTSEEECSMMWDLSRTRCLNFRNSDFCKFLQQTPFKAFEGLRSLRIAYENPKTVHHIIENYSDPRTPQIWLERVLTECLELQSLKIELSGWDHLISFRDAAALGTRLRKLRLRSMYHPWPISPAALKDGLQHCLTVVDLGLDLNVSTDVRISQKSTSHTNRA